MSGEHLNAHVCSIYDNFSLATRWSHKQTGLSVLPQDVPTGGRFQGPHQVLSGEGLPGLESSALFLTHRHTIPKQN